MGPSPQLLDFEHKLKNATRLVYTDDAGYLSFKHDAGCIASSGFSNGIGAVIATRAGALIGNFNQTDNGYAAADTYFRDLYDIYKGSLGSGKLIIYGEVEVDDQTTWKFPGEMERFIDLLEKMTSQSADLAFYLSPPKDWVDHEGTPLSDDAYGTLRSGGFLVNSSGGDQATTFATFVTTHMQKDGAKEGGKDGE